MCNEPLSEDMVTSEKIQYKLDELTGRCNTLQGETRAATSADIIYTLKRLQQVALEVERLTRRFR